jgi:sarcosine oxidase subunit delta
MRRIRQGISSYRENPKGIAYERWRHIHGCARFFNAVRDTVSDKFVTTYKAGEPPVSSVARGDDERGSRQVRNEQ